MYKVDTTLHRAPLHIALVHLAQYLAPAGAVDAPNSPPPAAGAAAPPPKSDPPRGHQCTLRHRQDERDRSEEAVTASEKEPPQRLWQGGHLLLQDCHHRRASCNQQKRKTQPCCRHCEASGDPVAAGVDAAGDPPKSEVPPVRNGTHNPVSPVRPQVHLLGSTPRRRAKSRLPPELSSRRTEMCPLWHLPQSRLRRLKDAIVSSDRKQMRRVPNKEPPAGAAPAAGVDAPPNRGAGVAGADAPPKSEPPPAAPLVGVSNSPILLRSATADQLSEREGLEYAEHSRQVSPSTVVLEIN